MMWPGDEEEIREVIGRELDEVECGTYETLDAIPPAVEAIACRLGTARLTIIACRYLHERVPRADRGEVMLKLEAILDRRGRGR